MKNKIEKIDITELNEKLIEISKMEGDDTIQSRATHGKIMEK